MSDLKAALADRPRIERAATHVAAARSERKLSIEAAKRRCAEQRRQSRVAQ